MSTNFYFENVKSKQEVDEFNEELEDEVKLFANKLTELGCDDDEVSSICSDALWKFERTSKQIHIGKRSMGWKPLFQAQEEYDSIHEMKKWYESNKDKWRIVDEYDNCYCWEQLLEELIYWNRDNDSAQSHLKFDGEYGNYYIKDGVEWTDGEFS